MPCWLVGSSLGWWVLVAEARPRPCASGVVAHGWNIDEESPCWWLLLVRLVGGGLVSLLGGLERGGRRWWWLAEHTVGS